MVQDAWGSDFPMTGRPNKVMNYAPTAPDASFGSAGYERRYAA